MITYEEAKELFTYDRETGIIKWKYRFNPKQRADLVAGCTRSNGDGYTQIGINGKLYPAHRIAMLLSYGFYGDGLEVDHINHIRNDNRLSNLRFVTVTGNRRNQSISSRNTTGVTGVYLSKRLGKYIAQIKVDREVIYLGIFSTLEEAAKARKDAELKYKFNANHGTNKAMYVRTKANA